MENLNETENEPATMKSGPINVFEIELNSTSPTLQVENDEEESKAGFSSFDNSGLSTYSNS